MTRRHKMIHGKCYVYERSVDRYVGPCTDPDCPHKKEKKE